jgi:Fic family protein
MVFQAPPLDDEEIAVLAKVGELSAGLRLRLQEIGRSTLSLARLQFARALQGSAAIDGFVVALDDITAIDLGELPIDVDDETRFVVKGQRDALSYVSLLATDDDFLYSAQLLKSLHFVLGGSVGGNRRGRWRVGPVSVQVGDSVSSRYVGPDAKVVPALMGELVESLQASEGPPALVRAAIAHLNILSIRPFDSHNGSMSRCLHSLVLARQGALTPTFGSVDEYLGQNAPAYAEVFARVVGDTYEPERDARPWVRFMLTAHLRQAQTLKRRVNEDEMIWKRLEKLTATRGVPDRSVVALFDAALGLRVRSGGYRSALDEASLESITEATASRDLRQLADEGLLEAVGEKRGRHYRATREVTAIREALTIDRKKERADPFER